jgi:hypothetical protein
MNPESLIYALILGVALALAIMSICSEPRKHKNIK